MKRFINYMGFIILLEMLLLNLEGCKKKEFIRTSKAKPEKILIDFIGSSNTGPRINILTLSKDTVYIIENGITRKSGEQLIIEEGTVLKIAGFINIEPGGILVANGTASEPIVFTQSDVTLNQGKNWGGITIEGRSTNNSTTNTADPTYFSGSMRYCRLEFAPLILRAVGSNTIIENIMVSYTDRNGLSAYNIYGGTFNARNLISYACSGPSDFYITNGYTGKIQNILAYRHPLFGTTGSVPRNAITGLFIENSNTNPINARPLTFPVISNMTVIGPNGQNGSMPSYSDSSTRSAALITTGNAGFSVRNSLFMGFPKAAFFLDDSLTAASLQARKNTLSYSIFQANDTARAFYLQPGLFFSFGSNELKNFLLSDEFKNRQLYSLSDFLLKDVFNYNFPELLPNDNSIVLTGAKFDGPFAVPSFFTQVDYLGAFGKQDWTTGWVNFTPLKTTYNSPE